MSWSLGPNGETYNYRMAVTAITNSITPGNAYDVAITIGPDQESFWATVQSSGYDVRLSTSVGNGGGITYQRYYWAYASKGAILRATVTLPATAAVGAVHILYIYWGPTGGAVATDPSSGTYTPTVSGQVTAPLVYPDGQTIRIESASWQQSGDSNTPSALQTAVVGVGEGRWATLDTGPGASYPTGFSLNGSATYQDVDWVHVSTTGVDASAPNWVISAGLRFAVESGRGVLRSQIDVTHASDGLAVYQIGAESGRLFKHYLRIRGIAPVV
jgi:hypothetical protein